MLEGVKLLKYKQYEFTLVGLKQIWNNFLLVKSTQMLEGSQEILYIYLHILPYGHRANISNQLGNTNL